MDLSERTIAVIGGGSMAQSIIRGCMVAGITPARTWLVAEHDEQKRAALQRMGVWSVREARELSPMMDNETQVLLAFKPQSLAAFGMEASGLNLDRVVMSILAGVNSATLRKALGGAARIVRVMPNLPSQIGRGVTAIALGAGAEPGDERVAESVFGAVGRVVETVHEDQMDAFTAIAGSGPAYVFYLAEVMTKAAESLGLDEAMARRVVREVIAGSGEMMVRTTQLPQELRAGVTSKGGTTEAAMNVLDKEEVYEAFMKALTAARDRARALGS